MRTSEAIGLAVSIAVIASCSNVDSPSSDGLAQRGAWGSSEASLSVVDTGATINIMAANCFGSYGDIPQSIPKGPFVLSGVYTQLMGAYPGKVEYAAQFSGTVGDSQMSITITVPALQRSIGPLTLVRGVAATASRCLYP